MANLQLAYQAAQAYAKDAELEHVLEVASGWVFTFAAGAQARESPVCYVSREGKAGPLFMPDHLEEMLQGTSLTDQQIQELKKKHWSV